MKYQKTSISLNRKISEQLRHLFPEDVAAVVFMLIYIVLAIIFNKETQYTRIVARHYFYTFSIIIILSVISGGSDKKIWRVVRNWFPLFVVYSMFENLGDLVHRINPNDMDWLLIKIDYWIFGVHPTVWMEKYVNLWLSDYLHFAYTSYYMIPPTIAGILYFRGQYLEFRELVVAGVLGAYLGYIGYVSVPAIGPRYTQSHLYTIGIEGKYITHVIRYTLDMLEPTRRDCFPSLHTALTAIPTWYAFKYLRKIFYFLVPISISLFIATIYGRYHYVIDIIAGLLLAWLCVWCSPKINRWWYQHITPKPLQDYFPKSIEKTQLFVTIHQLIKPRTREGNQ